MLKKGINIRVINKDGKGGISKPIGKIILTQPTYIVVKFDNYIECFNIADIVNPASNKLQIKQNKEWVDVTKDMLPSNMIRIEHLETNRAFSTCSGR